MAKATALARARRVKQRPKPKPQSAQIGPDGPKHPDNRQLYNKRGCPDAGARLHADYPKPKVATFCAALWLTFTLPLTRAFFEYVDAAKDPAIRKFARKHLEVKQRKSPGLPTLIERATSVLNEAGFTFGSDLPKRINKRRATMFYSSPLMDERDVKAFYEETSAVTAMLTLLTLRDFGVDLLLLSDHHSGMGDFRQFMKRTNPDNS